MITTPSEPLLPTLRNEQDMKAWADALVIALEAYFKSLHIDLKLGATTHRVLDAAPEVDNMEEGEIVAYEDEVDVRLVIRVNGVDRYVSLI